MPDDPLAPLLLVVRLGLNVSALLAVGWALHGALGVVEREGRRRALRLAGVAALVGVVFGLARLVLLSAQIGGGPGFAFDSSALQWAWGALGPSTLALIMGSAGILVASQTSFALLAGMGAATVAASFGLTGHTQGLNDAPLASVAVAVHVLIAGFWIAAPLSLWPSKSLAGAELYARLIRFSTFAVAVIPVLAVLGVWLAWLIAGGASGLLGTVYGRLLLLKFAVTLVAMAVGAFNHRVVTALILRDPARGEGLLRTTLTVEAAVFIAAVLAVSAATTIGAPTEP